MPSNILLTIILSPKYTNILLQVIDTFIIMSYWRHFMQSFHRIIEHFRQPFSNPSFILWFSLVHSTHLYIYTSVKVKFNQRLGPLATFPAPMVKDNPRHRETREESLIFRKPVRQLSHVWNLFLVGFKLTTARGWWKLVRDNDYWTTEVQ